MGYKHHSVHTITGHRLHSTDRAVQFRVDKISGVPLKTPRVEWFPFSQVDKTFYDPNKNDADWMIVSGWILEQKGLEIPAASSVSKPSEPQRDLSPTSIREGHFDAYDDDVPF